MDRVELDEEGTKAVVSQLTSYDNFWGQFSQVSEVDPRFNRYYAVVMVPPKAPDTKEKWVAVSHAGGGDLAIYPTVREPDPERKAICSNIYGGENDCCFYHCYWYADELPRCMVLTVVFAIILSILTTPLILLCFVPMIHKMWKAQREINNNDTLAAGRHWRSACQWPYLGACVWTAAVLPFVLMGLFVGIVLAILISL